MFRQPIHRAAGAMPIWFVPPSSPTIVPAVWVPWPWSSHGSGELAPQLPPPAWMASCQWKAWEAELPFHPRYCSRRAGWFHS